MQPFAGSLVFERGLVLVEREEDTLARIYASPVHPGGFALHLILLGPGGRIQIFDFIVFFVGKVRNLPVSFSSATAIQQGTSDCYASFEPDHDLGYQRELDPSL